MSEVSMLSAQFRALSKAVDQVNHAVIVFKAQYVNIEQGDGSEDLLELDPGELDHATDYMKDFIDKVASLENPDDKSAPNFPNAAAAQLQSTVIAEIPDFFEQLRTIRVVIENKQIFTLPQLELLDHIVEALDQERSELFKKLRAARG